jgi:selenocysteine lyase/cysteine desulfurase
MKEKFVLEDGVTYLNCASMSPLLKSVKAAGLVGLEVRSAPWKIETADWFDHTEKLRGLAAGLFNAATDDIAIIPSASYGLATAAKNLKVESGKTILVLEDQYPSNYYIWQQLAEQFGLKLVTVKRQEGKSLAQCLL